MTGTATSPKRVEFVYRRGMFLQRLLLLAVLAVNLLVFLALLVPTPPFWLALTGAALTVYLVVSGVSPLLTDHWLTTTRLILRQGWYFRAVVPLRSIRSVEPFEGKPKLGLSAPWGRRRLYVTGSKEGLVAVRLATPRRFWQVLGAEIDEIVFDVDARERFLAAFAERKALLAPVEAERTDSDLRD
ncbi:MAG: hypothetical protein AABX36_03430 [Candidatus Thermoplasmatota archaeon]